MPSGTTGRCGISATTRAIRRRGDFAGIQSPHPQMT